MAKQGLYDRIYASMGTRMARRLEDEVGRSSSTRPPWTIARLIAFALAIVVHALTLLLLAGAIYIAFAFGVSPISVLLAVPLVALAWVLRPRGQEPPSPLASRADHPALFDVIDRVAHAVGTTRIERLVVDEQYNASVGRYGLLGPQVMTLGLPLMASLDGQERVALIAHELGHRVNGDPTRGLFVGTALQSLATWYDLLRPRSLTSDDRGLDGLLAIPANLVLVVVSQFIYVVGWTFVHLLYRENQRGEYLADRLAGDVAGRNAAVSVLEKSHLGDDFDRQVTGLAINDQRDLLSEWHSATASLSSQDRERAKAAARKEAARLDATHPPTAGRIRLLEARPQGVASVVVSASDQQRIDAELAQHERRVHAELADQAAAALYG